MTHDPRRVVAFDFETHLIQPGVLAPRVVCGAFDDGEDGELCPRDVALATLRELLADGVTVLAGANVAFDFGCAVTADPSLESLVFRAYDEGRVYDVQVAQALDAVAGGHLGLDPSTMGPIVDPATGRQSKRYSLATCVYQVLGRADAKANNEWVLRYAELDGVPLDRWPEKARQYPLDDVRNTAEVALAQLTGVARHAWRAASVTQVGGGLAARECARCGLVEEPGTPDLCRREPHRNAGDHAAQVYAAWCLHLGAMRGLVTDRAAVDRLRAEALAERERYDRRFARHGWVGDGATSAVKRAVALAYGASRPCPAPGCRDGKALSPKTGNVVKCVTCDGTGLDLVGVAVPTTRGGGVSKDRDDALAESGDDELTAFGDNRPAKVLDTYLPWLEQGCDGVALTTRPNVLVASGRVSYDGLVQLLPRGGGVRGCFVPRAGYVYCSCDYAAIELCALAQVVKWLFGSSTMADVICETGDPGMLHTAFGASMVGLDVAEMSARLRSPDAAVKAWAKNRRWAAKAANFGFPGGMGAAKLVLAQRRESAGETVTADGHRYPGLRFCVILAGAERCGAERVTEWRGRAVLPTCRACLQVADEQLRPAWFARWHDVGPSHKVGTYHHWVNDRVDSGAPFPCFGTERERGGCGFTDGANNGFQALAADGAKAALRALTRECYLGVTRDGAPSPLAGSRPLIFLHDEIVAELPESVAHEAAHRMADVMRDEMARYMPDVVVRVEPATMRRWYKEAEPSYVDGRLVPWEPRP